MDSKPILRTFLTSVAVLILIFVAFNIAITTNDIDTSVFAETSTTLP